MGSLLDDTLRRPRPASQPSFVAANQQLDGDTHATLLMQRREQWAYGPEIPIQVSLHNLKAVALPGGADSLFWSGIEVRIKKSALPDWCAGGCFLTATLLPRSYLWCAQAPLLPGRHPRAAGYGDSLRALAAGKRIADLAFDPIESDPGWLVARLGDPLRPHWDPGNTEAGDGFLIVRNRNRKAPRRRDWVFGICPAPPEHIVFSLEQDGEPFLESWVAGSAKSYIPPRQPRTKVTTRPRQRLDGLVLKQMASVHAYRPGLSHANLCLTIAARQALGRRTGSTRSLRQNVSSAFIEHYRNLDQRMFLSE